MQNGLEPFGSGFTNRIWEREPYTVQYRIYMGMVRIPLISPENFCNIKILFPAFRISSEDWASRSYFSLSWSWVQKKMETMKGEMSTLQNLLWMVFEIPPTEPVPFPSPDPSSFHPERRGNLWLKKIVTFCEDDILPSINLLWSGPVGYTVHRWRPRTVQAVKDFYLSSDGFRLTWSYAQDRLVVGQYWQGSCFQIWMSISVLLSQLLHPKEMFMYLCPTYCS
jgi:hypothetical protein